VIPEGSSVRTVSVSPSTKLLRPLWQDKCQSAPIAVGRERRAALDPLSGLGSCLELVTSGVKTTIDWKTSDDTFRGDVDVLDSFRDNLYCAENPGVCAPLGFEWSCLVYCASNACPVNGAEGRGLTMSLAEMRAETAAKDEQLFLCESGLSSPLYCDLLACALVRVPRRRF
jgi:hypothetical protein